jgi:NAD(P)-dependent dehydrogenase (short-subunit alcohol dehydrogenase family)
MSVEAEYRALLAAREIATNLAALTRAGAAVEYLACDVRDGAAFAACLRSIYQRHGRIDGVIHGAGLTEDAPITAKSPESFARVFDTKVVPALVLARELRPESLRFVAFFSSVAAHFGNDGQCDYAAANGVLDALAARLDRLWPARVVSVAWGPWAEVGMAAPHLRAKLRERGFEYLDPATGAAAFRDELERGAKGEANVILYAPAGEGPVEARAPSVTTSDGA